MRRGVGSDCFYHPAPLTKNGESTNVTTDGSGREKSARTPKESTSASSFGGSASPLYRPESIAPRRFGAAPSARSTGFLGASSSTAVVAELNGSLGVGSSDYSTKIDSLHEARDFLTNSNL